MAAPLSRGYERWLAGSLALWGAGVLTVELFAVAGAASCAVAVAVDRVRSPRQPWPFSRWAGWMTAAFLAWALGAPLLAGLPPTGVGLARLSDWLTVPVAAVAAARLGPRRLAQVGWVCGAVFAVSCAVAALQHLGRWPALEAFGALEWTRIPFRRVYEPVPHAPGRYMAGGLAFHRLVFSHVGGLAVLTALALGLAGLPRARAFATLALAAVGLTSIWLFPYARMASVALTASGCAVWVLSYPRKRWAWAGAAALALGAMSVVVLHPAVRARFASVLSQGGTGDRGALWATGLRAVAQHPLTGTAMGRFRPGLFADETTPAAVREQYGKTHNQLLSLAAEGGVLAPLLFLAMLVAWVLALNREHPLGVAGLGAVLFFALLSQTHDPLFHATFSLGLCGLLGVCIGAGRAQPSTRS